MASMIDVVDLLDVDVVAAQLSVIPEQTTLYMFTPDDPREDVNMVDSAAELLLLLRRWTPVTRCMQRGFPWCREVPVPP